MKLNLFSVAIYLSTLAILSPEVYSRKCQEVPPFGVCAISDKEIKKLSQGDVVANLLNDTDFIIQFIDYRDRNIFINIKSVDHFLNVTGYDGSQPFGIKMLEAHYDSGVTWASKIGLYVYPTVINTSRRPSYRASVAIVDLMADFFVNLFKQIKKRGIKINFDKVFFITSGYAAHIAARVGKRVRGIGNILALQPARPIFERLPKKKILDKSDAKSVTVVHFGNNRHINFDKRLGNTDIFLLSDAYDQTDTSIVHYFSSDFPFKATPRAYRCKNEKTFRTGKCLDNRSVIIPNVIYPNTTFNRGVYYSKVETEQCYGGNYDIARHFSVVTTTESPRNELLLEASLRFISQDKRYPGYFTESIYMPIINSAKKSSGSVYAMIGVPIMQEEQDNEPVELDIALRYYFEEPFYKPFIIKRILISSSDLKVPETKLFVTLCNLKFELKKNKHGEVERSGEIILKKIDFTPSIKKC